MSTANAMRADDDSRGRHSDNDRGNPAGDQPQRLEVAVTLEHFIPGDIGKVFYFVAAQDVLPTILTGYGLVPGVASTSNVSGP